MTTDLPYSQRLVFNQTARWPMPGVCVYSREHCCYCGRPIRNDAKLLCLARTNDGEWWVVPPSYIAPSDDLDGGGMFTLPVGPDCLRRHPEWAFAVVNPTTNSE